jgi:hypothetical protein
MAILQNLKKKKIIMVTFGPKLIFLAIKIFFLKAEKPFLTNSYFLGLPHMENDNMIFYWRFLPTLYIKTEKFGAT